MRTPLKEWAPYKRASGPHSGIHTANVPWEIYAVCSNGHGIDPATYHLLDTCLDMDGLQDLLEMLNVHSSWKHAEMRNQEWRSSLPKGN